VSQLRLEIDVPPTQPGAPRPGAPSKVDRRELTGNKGSVFYRAHSYHTKVPPEGIVSLIEHYTAPGDIVVDPFCGSGMTGVAGLLSGRRAVLSDLSPAAVHIAKNYTAKVDPDQFAAAGRSLLADLASLELQLYAANCGECGAAATAEYHIWSDVFSCPSCEGDIVFWDRGLDENRSKVVSEIVCSHCSEQFIKRDLAWVRRIPVAASVACGKCRKRTMTDLDSASVERVLAFARSDISEWYPTAEFAASREMWRGQHRDQGLTTAADFFTPRNLRCLAQIWSSIRCFDQSLLSPLQFAFTSIVNRASIRYQWNAKRPTNVLSSTMYVPSLSYEFNVFSLLRRKLRSIADLYRATQPLTGVGEVHQAPAQSLGHLPDSSVDYVFTDPPFGSNIFYGDASFLWEAWLDAFTPIEHEAVVNKSVAPADGGKSVADYEHLMTGAFQEVGRVLKPDTWASVMFHNSSDEVWSALQRSVEDAGFEVEAAVAFDKSQLSFKGIKGLSGERVPNFDVVLHMRRRSRHVSPVLLSDAETHAMVIARLRAHLESAPRSRRTTAYLHSLVMRVLLETGTPIKGWTYRAVEDLCAVTFTAENGVWRAPGKKS
jgi:16S rRNA G966 N2-methylase RsmD/DNA-directed RNA polymerase subunit RPC12/RpoP